MDPLGVSEPDIAIEPANPFAPDIAHVIATHIERSRRYYPIESCHTYGPEQMQAEGVDLFVARIDGTTAAIGGLKPLDADAGEIKSMHTLKQWRGHGLGTRLVSHVIQHAKAKGLSALYLETGTDDASLRARKLYGQMDFVMCGSFGEHVEDPNSVFMRLDL